MTSPVTDAPPRGGIGVALDERRTVVSDALNAFVALRGLLGQDRVFLLESLAGPDVDRRSSAIGFTGLLRIEVTRGQVGISGQERVAAMARAALEDAGAVRADGVGLMLRDDDALWELPRIVQDQFAVAGLDDTAYGFGFLTYYGYDAVRYIEALPRLIPGPGDGADLVPDATFELTHGVVEVDLRTGEAVLRSAECDLWEPANVEAIVRTLEMAAEQPRRTDVPEVPAPRGVTDSIERDGYLAGVEVCLGHIRIGDIYQVQYGHEIRVTSDIDDISVYQRLRMRNPSPYMAVLPVAGHVVVCASPELFLRTEAGVATMRPIAGTARRTGDPEQDAAAVARLQADEKEIAEHIMLVDLCRNDLGRVAAPMSIDVDELMVVENYSHMFHLVSNVTIRIREGVGPYELIRATFPAGTMTGAPKVRAMEIIEERETSRRGLYAGAFGLVGAGGWSNLGLGIRMATKQGPEYVLRASAGVVADSVPESEWSETLAKMGASYWAVTGEELS